MDRCPLLPEHNMQGGGNQTQGCKDRSGQVLEGLENPFRRMLIGKGGLWKPRIPVPSFPSPSTSFVLDERLSKTLPL